MKIDNYIRHLELQRKGLRERKNKLLKDSDIRVLAKGHDPNFKLITETRNEFKEINDKLTFLRNLRKEIIKYEVQNQTNKQR